MNVENKQKNKQKIIAEERELIAKRRFAVLKSRILRINQKLIQYLDEEQNQGLELHSENKNNFYLTLNKNVERLEKQLSDKSIETLELLAELEKLKKDENGGIACFHKYIRDNSSTCSSDERGLDKRLRKILSLSASLEDLYFYWQEAINPDDKNFPLCGLALSGGGIRSATFNLGLLQALDEQGAFPKVDYLSTVSGGGYIGSSLTYNVHRDGYNIKNNDFPFERGNTVVRWIRQHASYLTPGAGLNYWALIAAVLRGILINLTIIIPTLFVIMLILKQGVLFDWANNSWAAGYVMLAAFIFMYFLRIIFLKRYKKNEDSDKLDSLFCVFVLLFDFSLITHLVQAISNKTSENSYFLYFWPVPIAAISVLSALIFFMKKHESTGIRINDRFVKVLITVSTWLPTIPIVIIVNKFLSSTSYQCSSGFRLIFLIACVILSRLMLANLYYALLSFVYTDRKKITQFSIQYGDYLLWGLLLLLFGSIPMLHDFIFLPVVKEGFDSIKAYSNTLTITSIAGLLSTAIGWFMDGKKELPSQLSIISGVLLKTGIPLLLFSGLVWSYHLLPFGQFSLFSDKPLSLIAITAVFVIWLALVVSTDINHVSMHRFYRNRLVEAFFRRMFTKKIVNADLDESDPFLKDINIEDTGAPYPLINANIVTVGSSEPKLANRGGDSFIFSPKYIGSCATGWEKTNGTHYRRKTLGTAMAISGAAVDPNTGETKSWPLRVLMGILNVRLGYWLVRPNALEMGHLKKLWQESWLTLINLEMFGFPKEDWQYIRLSDGGHFENLGLYELVRRQCKTIVVSDAGADPDWIFSDLSRAIQRVRVDFEADIVVDLEKVKPNKETKRSECPFVTGTINYQDGTKGDLIYIKTTLFSGLPEDVLGYSRQNEKFPDEPTKNQFYTEEQFEAYRILGYHAGIEIIKNKTALAML